MWHNIFLFYYRINLDLEKNVAEIVQGLSVYPSRDSSDINVLCDNVRFDKTKQILYVDTLDLEVVAGSSSPWVWSGHIDLLSNNRVWEGTHSNL